MELGLNKIIIAHYGYNGAENTYAAYLIDRGSGVLIAKVFGEGKQQCRARAEDFLAKLNRRVSI